MAGEVTHKDINLLSQKATLAGTEKLPVSDIEYITPEQIVADVYEKVGFYTDDPVYIKAVVDKDFKVLYGVKTNGDFYFGKGVPPQVKGYVDTVVGDIETLLAAL